MPGVPYPPSIIRDIKGIKNHVRGHNTQSEMDPEDVPAAPTGVDLDFKAREKQNKIDYDAVVKCNASTPNLCAAEIGNYVFQMKAVKENGDSIPENKLDTGEDIKWSRVVSRRNASDMDTPHAPFERVPHPKEWYYVARARVIDRIGHLGEWSDWTSPQKAPQEADPDVPVPSSLAINFDRVGKDRHHRYRAIVQCNEINNWDIPGGDHEGDVKQFEFEIRISDVDGTVLDVEGRRKTIHQGKDSNSIIKAVFFPVRKHAYYIYRARAIDRYNRASDWSDWEGPATVVDNTPPPIPEGVFVEGLFNKLAIEWTNPEDANGDPHEDVDYFQVQLARDRDFDDISRVDTYVAGNRKTWDSRNYKQRFWMRVRAADASGNKSAWVDAGPVKPQKATAGRQVVVAEGNTPRASDIDWGTDAGIDLAGQVANHAYNVSGTNGLNLYATVDGEFPFGTIEANLLFSGVVNRTKLGVVFHWIDTSNYMYVVAERTVANGSLISWRKVDAGVDSLIASFVPSFVLEEGQSYILKVVITQTTIQIQIGDVTFATSSKSSANQTKYNAATTIGLYKKRGATTDDNGGSRHESFMFTADTTDVETDGEVVVDDDFERQPSTSSLGIAASGQTWVPRVGTWGIIDESIPTALFGYGMILPILYMDDPNERNGINVKSTGSGNVTLMAQGGESTGGDPNNPLTIEIDRPTRILMMAWANFMNESGTNDYNMHFFAAVEEEDGTVYLGRQTKAYGAIGDAGPGTGKRRLLSTAHQVFLDPGASGTMEIKFYWGYRQSDSSVRPATIANQKMIILLSYAPDYDPAIPISRVPWSRSSKMAKAYRGAEPDDA
jgi:hypothetical protein